MMKSPLIQMDWSTNTQLKIGKKKNNNNNHEGRGICQNLITVQCFSTRRYYSTCLFLGNTIYCYLCYDRALLPSIICLGRLRIASKYIFNLWQLRQGVDSLAQWLEHWIFNREDRVRFPREAGIFFSYASFFCYDFHVVRWGLVRDWTLYAENGFMSS